LSAGCSNGARQGRGAVDTIVNGPAAMENVMSKQPVSRKSPEAGDSTASAASAAPQGTSSPAAADPAADAVAATIAANRTAMAAAYEQMREALQTTQTVLVNAMAQA